MLPVAQLLPLLPLIIKPLRQLQLLCTFPRLLLLLLFFLQLCQPASHCICCVTVISIVPFFLLLQATAIQYRPYAAVAGNHIIVLLILGVTALQAAWHAPPRKPNALLEAGSCIHGLEVCV